MFDLKSKESFDNALILKYKSINLPTIFCANVISNSWQGQIEAFLYLNKCKLVDTCKFVLMDGKSSYNLEKPFVYLIRQLQGNENLELTASSSLILFPSVLDDTLKRRGIF
jgi:hypothetical protein